MPTLPTKNSLLGCGKELLLDGDPLSCAWVEDSPANVDTAARIESTVIYFTSPSVQRIQAAGLKWARLSSSNRTSGLERGRFATFSTGPSGIRYDGVPNQELDH